jgi:endonuclease YncB( thermonuclease family)
MKPNYFFLGLTTTIAVVVLLIGSTPEFQLGLKGLLELGQNSQLSTSNLQKVAGVNNDSGIEESKITRVIDGDTVELEDGRKVRYLYIDTPETKKPQTKVQCFGLEAYTFNKTIAEGKMVQLISDKEPQDKYGRDLRLIFLAGQNTEDVENSLNAIMVKQGFARASIYKPNVKYETLFYKLQREAQNNKVGLWEACPRPFEE